MTTIKKKDLKKYKINKKKEIDELVDADGAPIESGRNPTSDSEIETAPQQTSDEFAAMAIQPNRFYYGIAGTPYSRGSRLQSESEKELSEKLMKDMIENIVTKKSNNNDVVNRYKDFDVNKNGIPDLEELSTEHNKPVVAKKAQDVLKTINMNNLNGEEIGIVINYILNNVDLSLIPEPYKNILIKTLK